MAAQCLTNFKRPEEMSDPQDMLAIKENLHQRFFLKPSKLTRNFEQHLIASSLMQRSLI
jgi:hypothetical protein